MGAVEQAPSDLGDSPKWPSGTLLAANDGKELPVFRPGEFLIVQVGIPGRCISRCIQLPHRSALIRA
jgi:hypothetical protein